MSDKPQQWTQISLCVDPDKIHVSPDRSAICLGDGPTKFARLVSQASIHTSNESLDEADALDELERIGTAIVLAVARARRTQEITGDGSGDALPPFDPQHPEQAWNPVAS